jgi:ribonuclease P protein component
MTRRNDREGRAEAPLPSFALVTLKARQDFKAAQAGRRFSTAAFTMQRSPLPLAEGREPPLRFGFTVTKKLGNAVIRNRIRRRLREAVRRAGPGLGHQPMDLVLIARPAALSIGFATLVEEIARAVAALAAARSPDREKPAATDAKLGKPPQLGIEGA